ncbi:MAG: hypothetical protein J5601_00595, partial [Elusimicrobiaceae bacterium]|nr:hypothetical protein [Elusimicrobiaceae bacterium]
MKKLLSLVLSFTIIFSSITPALAQVQTSSSANVKRNIYNQAHPFIPGIMSEAMMKAMSRDQVKRELVPVEMQGNETFVESVYTQYLMEYYRAYEQEVKDKAAGVRFCEKNQFGSDLRCVGNFESEIRWVFDGADNEAAFYKAVKNGERYEVPIHMEWPYHGDKTVEKHDLITFAHGVLRWTLNDLMKGKDKIAEEEYVRFIDEVSHIAEVFDSATEDRADLKKFLETILQNGNKQCKGANGVQRLLSGSKFVPIGTVEKKDQAAQKVCEKLSEAVVLYGSMYANGEKGSAAASELIYQTVKDVYDENFGALVLQSGIGSLLMIDTPTSVNKIYELLMKDTVKELKWYASLKEILNLLSFEEWNKKGIAGVNAVRGGAGNYLNETGLQLQYVDEKTAKAYGLSDFSIRIAQDVIPSIQERYNLPYGNMLEDIGVMIASYKGKQTKGLVKRIQDAYLQNKYLKGTGDKLHMPLIVGIYSVLPKASVNKPLYEADWWDLNEGTQRRVNNLVGVPAGFKARTKDEAKMRRSLDNFKFQQLGFWTDILSIAIFGGMLVASLPSIVRSAATLLRHVSKIRAIRVARIRVTGHGKVLSNVRASMKARGITKQSIKTTRAKAQAPVKGKPQANANA